MSAPRRPWRRTKAEDRSRLSFLLTPAGTGVLSLFLPGLVVAAFSRQQLFTAISIGAGLGLVVDAVVARHRLRGLRLTVAAPVAVTVGQRFPVLAALARSRPVECIFALEHGRREAIPTVAPSAGEVELELDERGVVDSLRFGIQTVGPFGLTACVRRSRLVLPAPLHVAPEPIVTGGDPDPGSRGRGDTASADRAGLRGSTTSELTGIRPYATGDPWRDVHWPTVARTGTMMVRERAWEPAAEITVVVEAGPPGPELERLLGEVRHGVEQLQARGRRVRLTTPELAPDTDPDAADRDVDGGAERVRVTAPVTSGDDLLTRLARVAPSAGAVSRVAVPRESTWHPSS